MRNALIQYLETPGIIVVHDRRTSQCVLRIEKHVVDRAIFSDELDPHGLESLYDWVGSRYFDELHDYGLL